MNTQDMPPNDDFRLESLPQETCVRLLRLYCRMMVALDGFWYLACADRTGTEAAVESDLWVWNRLSRYVTHDLARALGIEGRQVADYVKVLQARPQHVLFAEEWEVPGRDRAVHTVRRCPTLLALEEEGQGRDATHCGAACGPLREAHARHFNPAFELVCRKIPPRLGRGVIACLWEYLVRAAPSRPG